MSDVDLYDDLPAEEAVCLLSAAIADAAALYFGLDPEQYADFGEWLMGTLLTDLDALAQEAFA